MSYSLYFCFMCVVYNGDRFVFFCVWFFKLSRLWRGFRVLDGFDGIFCNFFVGWNMVSGRIGVGWIGGSSGEGVVFYEVLCF